MRKNCAQPAQTTSKTWVEPTLLMNSNFTQSLGLCENSQVVPGLYEFFTTTSPQPQSRVVHLLKSYLSPLSTALTKTTTTYIKE